MVKKHFLLRCSICLFYNLAYFLCQFLIKLACFLCHFGQCMIQVALVKDCSVVTWDTDDVLEDGFEIVPVWKFCLE